MAPTRWSAPSRRNVWREEVAQLDDQSRMSLAMVLGRGLLGPDGEAKRNEANLHASAPQQAWHGVLNQGWALGSDATTYLMAGAMKPLGATPQSLLAQRALRAVQFSVSAAFGAQAMQGIASALSDRSRPVPERTVEALLGAIFVVVAARGVREAARPARTSQADAQLDSVRMKSPIRDWFAYWEDEGGITRATKVADPQSHLGYRWTVTQVDIRDAPGTAAYRDTAAHEGLHQWVFRHLPVIASAEEARLLGVPIGAPILYLEESAAYAFGHAAARRPHGVLFAPIEALVTLKGEHAAVVVVTATAGAYAAYVLRREQRR